MLRGPLLRKLKQTDTQPGQREDFNSLILCSGKKKGPQHSYSSQHPPLHWQPQLPHPGALWDLAGTLSGIWDTLPDTHLTPRAEPSFPPHTTAHSQEQSLPPPPPSSPQLPCVSSPCSEQQLAEVSTSHSLEGFNASPLFFALSNTPLTSQAVSQHVTLACLLTSRCKRYSHPSRSTPTRKAVRTALPHFGSHRPPRAAADQLVPRE